MMKHLNLAEMVALVSPWARKTKRRATFLAIPEIAALHPQLVDAHKAVLAVRPAKPSTPPALRTLDEKATRVDDRHDHLARATTFALDAEREHCLAKDPPDVERAAKCDEVNAEIFPNGMAIINASFLAESGNTARVAKLMKNKPEIPKFLKTITAPGKTSLYDTVERWISAGSQLEALEHDREEVLAQHVTKPVTTATIQAARSQWFSVVSTILSNLEISRAPAEAIEAIRGPVLRASERAGKRYAGGKPEDPVLDAEDQGTDEGEADEA